MRVRFFKSVDTAIKGLRKIHKEYTIVDHPLKKGELIESDVHNVDEYVIFNKGEGNCGAMYLGERKYYITLSKERATVIIIPAGTIHAFQALSDISYTVLRKGPAK